MWYDISDGIVEQVFVQFFCSRASQPFALDAAFEDNVDKSRRRTDHEVERWAQQGVQGIDGVYQLYWNGCRSSLWLWPTVCYLRL
jgi:hypothetical protein